MKLTNSQSSQKYLLAYYADAQENKCSAASVTLCRGAAPMEVRLRSEKFKKGALTLKTN
jgi:hypothetical protein